MGILDDAIREHLDLKRQHGARDAELQQLEDEAFGPPTRPGEPDFPERPPTGEHAEEGAVVTEAVTEEGAVAPEVEDPEPLADVQPPSAEPEEAPFFDQASEEAQEPEPELPSEPEPIAGEPTAEHPAPAPEPELESAEAPPAPEPLPQEESTPAEPRDTGGLEVGDLDLELDEEFEEFRQTEGSDEDAGEEEEDVLEETPEFLRDTPENERLWFEQGEPRDFDFDDEDEKKDDAP